MYTIHNYVPDKSQDREIAARALKLLEMLDRTPGNRVLIMEEARKLQAQFNNTANPAYSDADPDGVLQMVRLLELNEWTGFAALFVRDKGKMYEKYFVVSTTDVLAPNSRNTGISETEETMAFRADSEGNVREWGEIAGARGKDSRQEVIRQLANREDF